jgi:lysophospholipase L1-like esterase
MPDPATTAPARVATRTLLLCGTVVLAAVGARQLLHAQARVARRAIGKPLGEDVVPQDKVFKKRLGDPVDLLLLGDSIAAGLGAERRKHTLGGQLARRLARRTQRAVRLRTVARVGAETSMLHEQLAALPPRYTAAVAVIVVGGNDVTHRVRVADSVQDLATVVERLRAVGTEVVVGTCPDLGALRPVPQPLRALAGRSSRQLAAAQAQVVTASGGYAVSLAHVAGPYFLTRPDEMFALDRFHPSAAGYRRTAKALLPSVLAALGVADRLPFGHHPPATRGLRPGAGAG